MHRRIAGLTLACALVAVAACSSTGEQSQPDRVRVSAAKGPQPLQGPQKIVQLGDSIASGEGTLYGYTYDTDTQSWTGGDLNRQWPIPYPDCHTSPDAYGGTVAQAFGAQFTQFACTGATFDAGIAGPATVSGVTRRPAEFGNWDTQQDLNLQYDSVAPDLVLITLGADDVDFSDIVEDCVKNAYKHYWYNKYALECIDGNPGSSVQQHFFDVLPSVKKNYGTLVDWIEKRAEKNGVPVPRIVFTNYADPLPGPNVECPDARMLYDDQVQYLAKLLGQMNSMIESTIKGLDKKNVAVADISRAYEPPNDDHRWCSNDPWAYGLSIYSFTSPSSFDSQAPFHPTPAGQQAIAAGVIATVTELFKIPLPVDTTTTTAGEAATTTSSSPEPTSSSSTSSPPPPPDSTSTTGAPPDTAPGG